MDPAIAEKAKTISTLDWAVLAIYASVLGAMVVHFSRSVQGQDDYFLAGRTMSKWPIAFSLYVALFSTNTMLGATGWVNRPNGTVWIGLQNVGTMMAVPLIILLYPKIFFRLRITTAYEYLEKRFSYAVRAFGAVFFIAARIMWLSTMIYAAGLVVSRMLGWGLHGHTGGQMAAILLIGGVGTLFTLVGGMRGVIWTDVVQFFVLFIGVSVTAFLAIYHAGGVGSVLQTALETHRLVPPALFSFTDDLSVTSALSLGIFAYLSNAGADQVLLQTYLTAKSETEAKKSLVRTAFLKPLSLLFPLLGLLLFAYYRSHPAHAAMMRVPDDALPVFVIQVLPAGVRGLMIAAILSAVLTSVCAGLTALSACVQVDFVKRWKARTLSERGSVALARMLVLVWGILVSGGALFVRQLGEKNNIFQILNILMYPFTGVLLGIFLLGLLTRRANSLGAMIGGAAGFLGTVGVPLLRKLVELYHLGDGVLPHFLVDRIMFLGAISNFYYAAVGAVLTFVGGYCASLFFQAPMAERLIGLSHAVPDGVAAAAGAPLKV